MVQNHNCKGLRTPPGFLEALKSAFDSKQRRSAPGSSSGIRAVATYGSKTPSGVLPSPPATAHGAEDVVSKILFRQWRLSPSPPPRQPLTVTKCASQASGGSQLQQRGGKPSG